MDSIGVMEVIDGLYEDEDYSVNMEEVVNDTCDFMNRNKCKYNGKDEEGLYEIVFKKLTQYKDNTIGLDLRLVVIGEEDKNYLDFYVEKKLVK